MRTNLLAATTILLVGLAAPTFAQDDPHHPAESDVQAVESAADAGAAKPTDCPTPSAGPMDMMAMMGMMNGGDNSGMSGPMQMQMMATMQMMMRTMQMMQIQMQQMQMKMVPDPASSEGGSP